MIRNGDNDTLARKQCSSIYRLSVLNAFGNSLRVLQWVGAAIGGGGGPRMLQRKKPKDFPTRLSWAAS